MPVPAPTALRCAPAMLWRANTLPYSKLVFANLRSSPERLDAHLHFHSHSRPYRPAGELVRWCDKRQTRVAVRALAVGPIAARPERLDAHLHFHSHSRPYRPAGELVRWCDKRQTRVAVRALAVGPIAAR